MGIYLASTFPTLCSHWSRLSALCEAGVGSEACIEMEKVQKWQKLIIAYGWGMNVIFQRAQEKLIFCELVMGTPR